MLTEDEKRWLRSRPAYTSTPLTMNEYYYLEDTCRDWAETSYEPADWLNVLYRDGIIDDALYKDAAEFESRVSLQASRWQHGWETYCRFCPVIHEPDCLDIFESRLGFTCHSTDGVSWLVLKAARLKVEERM